ncbi:MAG TPA: S9 family peptidase [Ignavibacteriaceae bacterium]|nr:S9 family peptidase [Ignavibacteriaceae bacterium]
MKQFFACLFFIITNLSAQTKSPLTVEDLWLMKRLESFDISPDGKFIAFEITSYDMEANKGNHDINIINSAGGTMRTLKNSGKNETNPQFRPGTDLISYLLDGQIYLCSSDGSGEKKLTDLYSKVNDYVWSADGKKILFTSSVYPDCETQDCNEKRDNEKDSSKVKANIFTELMYRHWDQWRGEKRSHLFLFDPSNNEYLDLIPKSKFDVPPVALGSDNDFVFSPDGEEAAFVMNTSDFLAASTNNDVFIIDLKNLKYGTIPSYKKISQSKGNDYEPVYSPDGKYIAFLSLKREGFESDKHNIVLYDRKSETLKSLTDNLDLSADQIIWSKDSKNIFFTADKKINRAVFKIDISSGKIDTLIDENFNSDLALTSDGKTIFVKRQSSVLPYEIFSIAVNGKDLKQITFLNKERLSKIEMNPVETFWSDGAEGAKVQSLLVKPPFFDPKKKYPMIFLIHGGPQGNWPDEFHYRWNIQLFASKGYVVVAPNPRGSTGYGQKFTDEISRDWGGKVYTDLMNACDYALEKFNFIDKNNIFAAGASYGGYMIDWIEGHTDRFNALVSHDGVFNTESAYGTTEELWFPEWEFGGTPWESRDIYEKWSPQRFIQNAKTPMLLVHSANDFRVAEEEGFQLFTSLQRLGVESKLLYFPDESHFVTKPQNSRLWWNTIFDWFDQHKKSEMQ